MLLLRILLSICTLHGLYRLADDTPSTERTAYLPIELRRVWSVLALVLTILFWFSDSWWVLLPDLVALLAAMICRNASIRWDQKRLHITGMMGIRWDYEYAQLRYLPGKLPLLVTSNRVFILWPGMILRTTFIEEARERVRIAKYSQIYRKRAYKDTKQNAASRNAVASNFGLALLWIAIFTSLHWPITAETGSVVELTLEQATERLDDKISLHFSDAEDGRDYRLVLNSTTKALLEPDAAGKTYIVQREYKTSGSRTHRSRWYNVIAIESTDGTVYRSWEQSAANRNHIRPYAFVSYTLIWFIIHKHNPNRRK